MLVALGGTYYSTKDGDFTQPTCVPTSGTVAFDYVAAAPVPPNELGGKRSVSLSRAHTHTHTRVGGNHTAQQRTRGTFAKLTLPLELKRSVPDSAGTPGSTFETTALYT